jgi:hypothetical protein
MAIRYPAPFAAIMPALIGVIMRAMIVATVLPRSLHMCNMSPPVQNTVAITTVCLIIVVLDKCRASSDYCNIYVTTLLICNNIACCSTKRNAPNETQCVHLENCGLIAQPHLILGFANNILSLLSFMSI